MQSTTIDRPLDRFEISSTSPLPACSLTLLRVRGSEEENFEGKDRQAITCVLSMANMTRPNNSNAVWDFAHYSYDPAARHWEGVKKMVSDLKSTRELGKTFGRDGPNKLHPFADLKAPPIIMIEDRRQDQ